MTNLTRYASPLLALQLAAGCSAQPSPQAAADGARDNKAAAPSAATSAAPAREEKRLVLAFGDSLYAGYGLAPAESFPAVLQRLIAARGVEAELVNAGISGDTTAGGLRRLAGTLDRLERRPDLVILGLGANDALRGIPPAETERNLEAMIVELKRRGIPVLLTGLSVPAGFRSPYIARYEAIFPALAARHGAALEPSLMEGVTAQREYLLPDGLHPNARGVERMAERAAPLVGELLEGE